MNITSVSPASAEYSCRLANEADIPIQITESGIAEGEGKPFADVDFNWFEIYHTVAQSLRKDVPGDLSVIWLQGFLGTPPVMQGIKGFKEENVTDVTIVTVNGGPMDIENFKDGDLDYALSLSPGLHGMICAKNLISYLKGETYQKKSYSPIVWCNSDNWEELLIPWDVDERWMPVVEEFLKTGEYKPELRK